MPTFEDKRDASNIVVTILTLLRADPPEAGRLIEQIAADPVAAQTVMRMFAAQLLGCVNHAYGDADDPLREFALGAQRHIIDQEGREPE